MKSMIIIMKNYFRPPILTLPILVYLSLIMVGCQSHSANYLEESTKDALATFELAEGFQIELIADEPLIGDPVDMEIDEFGRLYVVEMHGYPLDLSGTGKVKLLSDTNGDGRMDNSIIFADSLRLPTGIMRWKKGVLVVDPPNVLYFEDSNGDGRADIKEVVLTGFALSNPQHNVNNPRLGIDNWIYLGHEPAVSTTIYEEEFGDRGSDVFFPSRPKEPRLPENAGGRSIRFRPDSYELELLASKTQFGHTFDAWGHRLLVSNYNHIYQEVIAAQYLDRNPDLLISNATQSLSDHGDAAQVFPITENPEHQLLTDVGVITSACGLISYLGGIFPSEYDHTTFVAEPVSNIVHVDRLNSKGTTFTASRLHQSKEFLASTDAWFRPVNMYIGPDGALYVVDYYRQIIEHPEWMAEEVVNSGALYNGTDKGRIYRISPKGTIPATWTTNLAMGDFTNEQLVEKLADPNIWWRRNAQRLLVDRASLEEVTADAPGLAALVQMAQNTASPLGRLHALWTLEGIKQLSPDLIRQALQDPEPGLRENAIKLAELHLDAFPDLAASLLKLQSDPGQKVRFQLLCTLGFIDTPQANQVRQALLMTDIEDEWMQIAALSAPSSQNRDLLEAVLSRFRADNPAYSSLVRRLSAMAAAKQQEERILQLIQNATAAETGKAKEKRKGWQAPVLEGLAAGLKPQELPNVTLKTGKSMLIKAVFEHPSLSVRQASLKVLQVMPLSEDPQTKRAMEQARRIAGNKRLPVEERVLGIHFLALRNPAPHEQFLKELMAPGEALPVQKASLQALSAIPGEIVAHFVLEQWPALTPELRDVAINTLMANSYRISLLLDAMEAGKIQQSSLGWRRSVHLMAQGDESLRNRSRALLSKKDSQRAEIIKEYQPVLEMKGSLIAGKAVFEKNCALCHKMGEEMGVAFGPDLASLKNRRPANIMSDILDPNLSIADNYDLWLVELKSGKTAQGIFSSETPTAITLRYAGGQENIIARQEIKSLKVLDLSAMPEGLENNINPQEMADLLAYIRKVK